MTVRVPIVLLLLTLFAAGTRATTLVPADLGQIAHESQVIVRGRVMAVDGQWTEDRKTIETLVTLQAERYLKGNLGSTFQFKVPGGDLGRYRRIVVGAPGFAIDEHVLVFLGTSGPMIPFIVGFNQGVFRVQRSADTGAWMVTPPALMPVTVETAVKLGDGSRGPVSLESFESRVQALSAGAK